MWMYILITTGAFLSMEMVAWCTHKYLMHGLLWHLHRDHHKKTEGRFFEKNDYFFLIFAIPGILLFLAGTLARQPVLLSIAAGITLYGFTYFVVHDIFIHQRFNLFRNTHNVYLLALRRAHKMHHKHIDKDNGECFGMLLFPFRYIREAHKARKQPV